MKSPNDLLITLEDMQWYNQLIEDCRDIITEAVFTSRWALIDGYHQLGERIVTDSDYQKAAKGNLTSFKGLQRT